MKSQQCAAIIDTGWGKLNEWEVCATCLFSLNRCAICSFVRLFKDRVQPSDRLHNVTVSAVVDIGKADLSFKLAGFLPA